MIWCRSENQNQSCWAYQFYARYAGHAKPKMASRSACPACQTGRAKSGNKSSARREIWDLSWTTIPDKTTWESFPHHVHFPTQQNYFQNDAFAERKPLPPIQCCFPQTPRDQAFFWIHNNIAFRGRGEGRTGTATMFRKMLSKYTIFSTVLSKIVGQFWAARAWNHFSLPTRCYFYNFLMPKYIKFRLSL